MATFKEAGYDLGPDFAATYMVLAKKGTPQNAIDKFANAVKEVMEDPEALEALTNLFYSPAVRVGAEADAWRKQAAGLFESMREDIKNDIW